MGLDATKMSDDDLRKLIKDQTFIATSAPARKAKAKAVSKQLKAPKNQIIDFE